VALFPLWFLLVFLPGFFLWPRAGAALAAFAERQTVRQRWAWAGLFFAVTVLNFGVRAWHGPLPESHRLYPLAGSACVLFGWLLGTTAVWFAATAVWDCYPANASCARLLAWGRAALRARPPARFLVRAPAHAAVGAAVGVEVVAVDDSDRVARDYTGTVQLSTSDHLATVAGQPRTATYTFQAGDGGAHTFVLRPATAGDQTLTATDTADGSRVGRAVLRARPAAAAAAQAPPPLDPILALCGRACGVVLAATALCEIIWLAAYWAPDYVSYRLYTIWAVFHICFLLSVTAGTVDVFHNEWQRPYRQAGVIAVVLLVAYVLYPSTIADVPPGQEDEPLDTAPAAAGPSWYDHFEARLNATDARAPVVFVAASGGGSRAALFTVLVLEALAREPLTDSTGAPLYRPLKDAAGRPRKDARGRPQDDPRAPLHWSDQIVLMSGVSGGSLGTAYYVRNRIPAKGSAIASPRNSFLRETELAFSRELSRESGSTLLDIYQQLWRWRPPDDGGSPLLVLDQQLRRWQRRPGRQGVAGCRSQPGAAAPGETEEEHARRVREVFDPAQVFRTKEFDWVVKNDPADAMCTDFMAPLLRGLMTPRIERGTALGHFWAQRFDWTGCNTLDGYGPDGYGPGRPLVLFNACEAREGGRFVVGFPPLPRGALHHRPRLADRDPQSSQFGSGPEPARTLTDFWPRYRVSLAEAVRMSANFPWGLRTARLRKDVYDLRPEVRRRFVQDAAAWDEARRALLGDGPNSPQSQKLAGLLPAAQREWLQGLDHAETRELGAQNLARLVGWLHELYPDGGARYELRARAKEVLRDLGARGYLWRRPQYKDLLDGGVNDNTGVPTLWEVVQHLRDLGESDPGQPDDPPAGGEARAKAKGLLDQLRRRGVVLVEIDSGAKPSLQPVAEVQTPAQGLNNAAYATAIAAKSGYYQRLNTLLQPDLEGRDGPGEVFQPGRAGRPLPAAEAVQDLLNPSYAVLRRTPLYVQVFECNHSTERDVMTAWALAPSDKARVTATFWCEYQQWRRLQRDRYRCWLAAWEYFKRLREDQPLDLRQLLHLEAGQRDDNLRALQKYQLMGELLKGRPE
jgi:hypothetical protein